LLNADMTRASAGRLLLRIEDIDTARCRPEYEAAIYEDLSWIGLQWEAPVWRQSSRWDDYRAALSRLEAMGLIYPSFETRAEIARLVAAREVHGPWPRDPDGVPLYPGHAKTIPDAERRRRIESGEPYALRLDMRAAAARAGALTWIETGAGPAGESGTIIVDASVWGDVILARKETPTSYHLAVALDDAAQGITDIVRGRDLFYATAVHRLLQALLGLPQPRYHHHKLLLGPDGSKLSKSTQSTGLRELREKGASPAEIRRLAGLD
jgi:glutamyl-Q tRNA(Asp) synthetase